MRNNMKIIHLLEENTIYEYNGMDQLKGIIIIIILLENGMIGP